MWAQAGAQGRPHEDSGGWQLSTSQGETDPTDTCILDFQAPEVWENKSLLFKLPNLCSFDMTALAN